MEWILALFGVLVGGLAGSAWAMAKARPRLDAAQEQLEAEREEARQRESELQEKLQQGQALLAAAEARHETLTQAQAEHKRSAEETRREFREAFEALAAKALKENSESLLEKTDLQLKPFADKLKALDEQGRKLEEARNRSMGELKEHLTQLQSSTVELDRRSRHLATTLSGSSQARGNWGEMLVARIFELAGMKEGVHYLAQKGVESGHRPDFQVLMPGGDAIPVDSKAPAEAFYRAQETDDGKQRRELLSQHAQQVRQHVRQLARKDYSEQVKGKVDFTVLFLPGDHLLDAALHELPQLHEESIHQGVLLATPVTLMALLKTVATYWKQDDLSKRSQELLDVAKEYHKRMKTFVDHFDHMGAGLQRANAAFLKAKTSYDSRVLPQGRRIEELTHLEPKARIPERNEIELDGGA